MRIHVTTRADLFEERKQQHIERGYRIEDERPTPVNGLLLVHRRERDSRVRLSRRTGSASAQWTQRFEPRLLRKDDSAPGREWCHRKIEGAGPRRHPR
jgi:hypothetical protein